MNTAEMGAVSAMQDPIAEEMKWLTHCSEEMFGKDESHYKQPTMHVEEVTIRVSLGAIIPTEVGHMKCNALVGTDATRKCISEPYYHILGFSDMKHLLNVTTISASG